MKPLKHELLVTLLLLACCLYLVLQFGLNFAKSELPEDIILKSFHQQNPITFWRDVSAGKKLNGLKVHHIFKVLESNNARFGLNESISYDAITGILYFRLGFLAKAEAKLRHVVSSTHSENELRQCLAVLVEIYQSQKNDFELKKVRSQLEAIDPRFRLNYLELFQPRNVDLPEKGFFKIYLLLVWFVLLVFPAILIEIERKSWLKRFAHNKDLRGPFLAFNRANLAGFLVVFSAILFILLKFPGNIGLTNRTVFLALHIVFSWIFCQIPFFKLLKLVRPDTEIGFWGFLREKLRTMLFLSIKLVTLAISLSIMHFMVTRLPFWPMKRSFGAVLTLPAIFTLLLVISHFLLPILLFAKKLKSPPSGLVSRVYTCGKGIHKSWLEFGAFSFLNTTLLVGGIQDDLGSEKINVLLKRSSLKLKNGSGFEEFLLALNLILVAAIYFAFDPLRMVRFFSLGPTFAEAAAFLLFGILGGYILSVRQRSSELESDGQVVKEEHTEELLEIYEKLNHMNFLPEKYREGDAGIFSPVSLSERKEHVRTNTGEYFHNFSRPEGGLLVSLWRSRLSIEWKLGIEEAVFITSLDYQVNEEGPENELRSMANKHARLGSECVFRKETGTLEVLFCAQKACAFITEETLPHAKICRICSKAMLKSLHQADYQWSGAEKGCRLKIKN